PDMEDALKGWYVRVRYNDEPVVVPGCRKPGNHLDGDVSFCTLVSNPPLNGPLPTCPAPPVIPLYARLISIPAPFVWQCKERERDRERARANPGYTKAAFKSVVDKFTPTNWRQECITDIDAPAIPAKPEEAGY